MMSFILADLLPRHYDGKRHYDRKRGKSAKMLAREKINTIIHCGGACAATKSSRKPWMRYGLTRIIIEPVLYVLMLAPGELGWNNAGSRTARAPASSSG